MISTKFVRVAPQDIRPGVVCQRVGGKYTVTILELDWINGRVFYITAERNARLVWLGFSKVLC